MKLALWHWHIEISSKCTLQCTRCPRTEVPDSLVNTDLDLAFFKKNFPTDFIEQNIEKISFCGDDGDPIYASEFLEVIQHFKSVKDLSIIIVTNGSYKKPAWWKKLASLLTEKDRVHFSLDGYDQASNEIYRVNSNWDSIIKGVKTLRANSNCFMSWDAIAFKFNEDHLDEMKHLAKELGFDQFQLTKSTKFGSKYDHYGKDDPLEPTNKELISSTHRFEREIIKLTERTIEEPWRELNSKLYRTARLIDQTLKPMCHIGTKGLYINSRGEFYPCCWVANRYGHNSKWLDIGKKYNLHNVDLMNVIHDEFWDKSFTENSFECTTKCVKAVVDKNYATEW